MSLTNVPVAGQTLLGSRDLIANNFTVIDAAFTINHIAYNLPDNGKHKFLQLPEQAAAPATAANEAGLYAKVGATSAVTELFFRRESSGTEIAFTESLPALNGWTRLPSGLYMEWGNSVTAASVKTVTLVKITTLYTVQVSTVFPGDDNYFVHLVSNAFAGNTFGVYSQKLSGSGAAAAVNFTWFAIGA